MERTYIVKQEKGSSIYDVAIKVAKSLNVKSPSIDFADRNGWRDDDIYDISFIDRYWQVEVCIFRGERLMIAQPRIGHYKFEIENENIEVCISEMSLIP